MATRRWCPPGSVSVIILGLLASPETAQAFAIQVQDSAQFQYVVKFVCGKSAGTVVAPGAYYSAINVHNPNDRGFGFKKKFAVALPGEKAGPVSKFFDAKLGPDEAFEIDCPDILRKLRMEGFVKGFAVIESAMELDVVAVYTAAGATRQVETMDVERVKPRRRGSGGGLPDLIPVPDPQLGFCKRKDLKLFVTVRNQGNAGAGASTTRVDFSTGTTASQPTGPLAAGASTDVAFDIPPGCFSPDCGFRITVDSGNAVVESNEANNTASGTCLG